MVDHCSGADRGGVRFEGVCVVSAAFVLLWVIITSHGDVSTGAHDFVDLESCKQAGYAIIDMGPASDAGGHTVAKCVRKHQ